MKIRWPSKNDRMRLGAFTFWAMLSFLPAQAADLPVEKHYFEDKTASLGIDDILPRLNSLPWSPAREIKPRFGPTKSRVWFRFRLPETKLKYGNHEPLLLEIENAYLKRVGFYAVLDGQVLRRSLTGMEVPLSCRGPGVLQTASTTFRIPAPRNLHTEYFLSIESVFPLALPMRLMEAPDYALQHWTHMLFLGFFFGGLLMAAAFNGFLALSLRNRFFRNYSLFVAGVFMAYLAHEGLSIQLLWPESPWWAVRDLYFFGGVALFFYAQFVREFLESARVAPWLDKTMRALVFVCVGTTAFLMVEVYQPVAIICQSTVVLVNFVALAIACRALARGVRSARYFFLSSLVFNVSIIVFQLQEASVLWIGSFVDKAPHVGTILEVALISLALADRVRQVNLEVSRQRAALVHSEKLSALGRMAGEIAHEINNPLAIIHGNAVLIRDFPTHPSVKDHAATIEETANRISKIVRGMRAHARDSRADPFQRTSLQPLLQGVLALCEKRAQEEGVKLELGPMRSDLSIFCRSSEICQVLVNLINNAIDAVEGLGNPVIKVEVSERDGMVELAVTDNGSGVSKEIRSRIHEPFFTTKGVGKGLGLGLSIARVIVEAHGGDLSLDESSPLTRFAFRLPSSPQGPRPS
jgi:signal transduction histidine kinase